MTRPSRGFTAVEMMVTVAVIAVLLAVVVPSFQEQLARRKLEGAATELTTDIQHTRTEAVSRNLQATLTTVTATRYDIAASGVLLKRVDLDPSLGITSGQTITYDPLRGLANAVTLDLTSSRTSAEMRVSTNPMGRVELCSPGGSLKGYKQC